MEPPVLLGILSYQEHPMGNCDFVKCVNTCTFIWFLHHHVMCICKEYVYMENGFVSCLREKNVSILERNSSQITTFFFFFSVSLIFSPTMQWSPSICDSIVRVISKEMVKRGFRK